MIDASERSSPTGRPADFDVMKAVLEALASRDRESVLNVLRENRPADSTLAALANGANLDPSQEAILNVLLGLQQPSDSTVPGDSAASRKPGPSAREWRELECEVVDLREVNDTLAAALGACAICWGGDKDCEACDGSGRAGHFQPDPALFASLIAPAVRRVRMSTTTGAREQFHHARR